MRSCHGCKQVRRKRRNAALARQVVADKRDLANFGTFFHEAVFHSSRPALLCTRVCATTANVPPQREVGSTRVGEIPACGRWFSRHAALPIRWWQEREKDIHADAVIVSMSPPSYPSIW